MARPLRVEFPGACYHIINRGNFRRDLFDRGGGEAFARALDEAARRFGWTIFAYIILGNHFHLALQISEPNLSEGLKWLQGTWIRRVNTFRRIVGRPFQGRYKAILVEDGDYLHCLCNYIHLNPVRAHILPVEHLLDYPLSSLPGFLGKSRPSWLSGDVALDCAGGLPDTPAGWKQYLERLQFIAGDPAEMKKLADLNPSRGWCLGSKEFARAMHQLAIEKKLDLASQTFGGLAGTELKHEKERVWEFKLQDLARLACIDLDALPKAKSSPPKALLAAAMKILTSVSNRWLALRLKMGKPASASQFARRWMLVPTQRALALQLVSRVKT